jgi:hypothetical protein
MVRRARTPCEGAVLGRTLHDAGGPPSSLKIKPDEPLKTENRGRAEVVTLLRSFARRDFT